MRLKDLEKHVHAYERGSCEYVWDELEEIITDSFDEGEITSEDFDRLMEMLMSLDVLEDDG